MVIEDGGDEEVGHAAKETNEGQQVGGDRAGTQLDNLGKKIWSTILNGSNLFRT